MLSYSLMKSIGTYHGAKVQVVRRSSLTLTIEFLEDLKPYKTGDKIVIESCKMFFPLVSEIYGETKRCRNCGQTESEHF